MAKYWTSDLQCKVMDECVQLFGGYGYMWEYPITRAYADARVQRIYGGTNEIMKEVISWDCGGPAHGQLGRQAPAFARAAARTPS
jgi:alkylation response protein AidB-like acyl-CoA dehydrogenase